MPRSLLSYLDRAIGTDACHQVVVDAGLVDEVAELAESNSWFSAEDIVRLASIAAERCGDADLGRRVGEEQILSLCEWGFADFLLAAGDVPGAMALVLSSGVKMSQGRTFDIVDVDDAALTVESLTIDLGGLHPFFCSYVAGIFATLPSVFGAVGRVTEPTCQARGDDRCRFRLTWVPDPRGAAVEVDTAAGAARFEERLASFERLQAMSADLLGTHDVDEVLERITERAAMAQEAPRFLLAVRVGASDRVRVHHRGFPSDELARDAAARLLIGGSVPGHSVLMTAVASAERSFGVLAALSVGENAEFSDFERRMMDAYAAHASAALAMVATLDDAERDRDTAHALLGLAGELAAVGTAEEIAARLASAAPAVTRSDVALLWGFHAEDSSLRLDAFVDVAGGAWLGPVRLAASDYPELFGLTEPLLMRATEAPDAVRWLFEGYALDLTATVPIIAHGSFFGVLTTAYRQPVADDDVPQLLAGLRGFADHAATALENAKLLADIRHQALHDGLTDLPNRPLVEDRANQTLAAAAQTGASTSLLFVDLDRFKNVNDTLGHGAGDDLIRQVARRLQKLMRATDTLARLGGDEFVVLLPDVDVDIALEIGQRIVDALHEPFVLCGREVFISCSIGVACAPTDGITYEALMSHADAAMYEAKAQGRNTLALLSDTTGSRRREQLELETALHRAIELGQLRVRYQPQIEVATGRVLGVEALVRWEHPALGLLEPGSFLQVAEDSGLIVEVDAYVRRTALAQAAAWARDGLHLRVALNLSTRDLHDPRLPDTIAAEIAAAGVDPALVELEITDRVVMTERDLPDVLHRLRALGVRLAIDDFGTGSSVLGRLQRCPIDTLKIDRSFVSEARAGSPEALVLEALVALGRSLQLDVVAEGVEEHEQHELLGRCGCDLAQGYLFGRPMEAAAITRLARAELAPIV